MAIINSVVIGRGRKSVGEISLRNDRGRTIASRRIFENKSNSAAQSNQRSNFAVITKALYSLPNFFVDAIAVRSRFGTQRNNYYKSNKKLLEGSVNWAKQSLSVSNTSFSALMGTAVRYMLQEIDDVRGNLSAVSTDYLAVIGNKDCRNLQVYNGSGSGKTIILDDVKGADVQNVSLKWLLIDINNSLTNGLNYEDYVNFVAGTGDDADMGKPLSYYISKNDNGTIEISFETGAANDLTAENLEALGIVGSLGFGLLIPVVAYKDTYDATRLCTIAMRDCMLLYTKATVY